LNANPENKAINSKATLESVDSKRVTGVPLNYNNKFEESGGVDISTRITVQPVKLKSTVKQISAIDSNDSPKLLNSKSRAQQTFRSERIAKPTTIAKPKNKVIITSTQIPISPIPVKIYSLRTTDQPMTTTQQPIQQEFEQQFQSQRHQTLEQNQQQTQQQQSSALMVQTSQPLQPLRLRQHLRKHLSKSEKRDQLTSDSSEDSYQYNFYDQTKNQNYLPNQQSDDPINSYSPLKYETYNLENPETYQYYSNAEPEPEPEPEVSGHYGETNYGFIQPSNFDDKNSIKILLEQFVRQLDFLKSVAERELNKANSQTIVQNNYNYKDSTKDYSNDDVIQPLMSNNAASYREHQNERSLEQTSSNYMAKELKDTNQKNERYEKDANLMSMTSLSNYLLDSYLSSTANYSNPNSEFSRYVFGIN
jgi:hypothetical protein